MLDVEKFPEFLRLSTAYRWNVEQLHERNGFSVFRREAHRLEFSVVWDTPAVFLQRVFIQQKRMVNVVAFPKLNTVSVILKNSIAHVFVRKNINRIVRVQTHEYYLRPRGILSLIGDGLGGEKLAKFDGWMDIVGGRHFSKHYAPDYKTVGGNGGDREISVTAAFPIVLKSLPESLGQPIYG